MGGEGRGQRACLLGSSVGAEGLPIGPLAAQWSGEREVWWRQGVRGVGRREGRILGQAGGRGEIGCIIIILVATFLHYQVYYTYYIIHTCISIDIEQSASLTFSVAVFRAGQSSDVLT